MTREEIIQAISDEKMMPFIQPEQLAKIVDFVIKNHNPSLPSNLDEAAEEVRSRVKEIFDSLPKYDIDEDRHNRVEFSLNALKAFALLFYQAGAEWMAGQGWIDDGSMPPETKHEGNTMQAHIEWTESKPVLAWDSMYGPCVDVTKNGKWMSEQRGGYTGQICHGIIAWRPIPEYKEKQ